MLTESVLRLDFDVTFLPMEWDSDSYGLLALILVWISWTFWWNKFWNILSIPKFFIVGLWISNAYSDLFHCFWNKYQWLLLSYKVLSSVILMHLQLFDLEFLANNFIYFVISLAISRSTFSRFTIFLLMSSFHILFYFIRMYDFCNFLICRNI